MQAVCRYLESSTEKEIYFTDILNAIDLSAQAFRNVLKNPYLIAFLEANNIEERKVLKRKLFVKK